MIRTTTITLLLVLGTAALGFVAAAEPPDTIHYQGVLRDSNDAPLSGNHDMIFRFYDSENGGTEILIDEHLTAGTGPVSADGGLFSVDLGAGNVLDGAGPGTYTLMADMFADHTDVWMEIQIDGGTGLETLSPRIKVRAAPYAHNASRIGGKAAADVLDTSSSNQTKSGSLTVDDLTVSGNNILFGFGGAEISVGEGSLFMTGGDQSTDDLVLRATTNSTDGLIEINGSEQIRMRSATGEFEFLRTDLKSAAVLDLTGLYVIGDLDVKGNNITFGAPNAGINASDTSLELRAGDQFTDDLFLRAGWSNADGSISIFGGGDIEFESASGLFRFLDGSANTTFELDPTHIRGREVGNFEVISTSSLHLVGDNNVRSMVDDDATTSTAVAAWYHDGSFNSTNQLAELQEDGDLRIGGTLSQNVAFDVAESFLAAEPMLPGDVVAVDPSRPNAIRRSRGVDDPLVLGVVSSRPGMLLGSAPFSEQALGEIWGKEVLHRLELHRQRLREEVLDEHPELLTELEHLGFINVNRSDQNDQVNRDVAVDPEVAERRAALEERIAALCLERFHAEITAPVALVGRVPVRVDTQFGAIRPGDALSASPIPGVAMRSDGRGVVIGTALEGLTSGAGTVTTFVHRGPGLGSSTGHQYSEAGVSLDDSSVNYYEENDRSMKSKGLSSSSVTGRFYEVTSVDSNDLRIDGRGHVFARGAFHPTGSEVAQTFPTAEAVEPGDVLCVSSEDIGSVVLCRTAYATSVIGVAAHNPGLLLGADTERIKATDPARANELARAQAAGDGTREDELWKALEDVFLKTHTAVAMTGIVEIKVDAGYGAINVGDALTSSPTLGHAMRADDPIPMTVMGKALEPLDSGTGVIRMLVLHR